MRRSFPALFLVVVACAGCAAQAGPPPEGLDRIVVGWERDGELVPQEMLVVARGAEHCDWTGVVFLQVADSPGDLITPEHAQQYLRDPDGALPAEYSAGLEPDAVLAADTEPTGFENQAGFELFLAPDGSTAYAVDASGTTEAWPRADPTTGCD